MQARLSAARRSGIGEPGRGGPPAQARAGRRVVGEHAGTVGGGCRRARDRGHARRCGRRPADRRGDRALPARRGRRRGRRRHRRHGGARAVRAAARSHPGAGDPGTGDGQQFRAHPRPALLSPGRRGRRRRGGGGDRRRPPSPRRRRPRRPALLHRRARARPRRRDPGAAQSLAAAPAPARSARRLSALPLELRGVRAPPARRAGAPRRRRPRALRAARSTSW